MFPESGRNLPFQIRNYAFVDSLGRETVTWIRTFQTKRKRRFDAYMIYSEQRGQIVDYLGTHQHLAVDIDLKVAPNGGIALRSAAQRFYEGPVGFSFPMLFSGVATFANGTTKVPVVFGSKWMYKTGRGVHFLATRATFKRHGNAPTTCRRHTCR